MHDVDALSCNRCKTRLLAESAVSVVVEVLAAGRVIERLQLFDLHRWCANLAIGPELNKRKKKYAAGNVVTIRHEVAANSLDARRAVSDTVGP